MRSAGTSRDDREQKPLARFGEHRHRAADVGVALRRRGAARLELALDVEPQDVHEILSVGDDAERLMRSAVFQLAHDELRRVDADRRQLAHRAVGLSRRTPEACCPSRSRAAPWR